MDRNWREGNIMEGKQTEVNRISWIGTVGRDVNASLSLCLCVSPEFCYRGIIVSYGTLICGVHLSLSVFTHPLYLLLWATWSVPHAFCTHSPGMTSSVSMVSSLQSQSFWCNKDMKLDVLHLLSYFLPYSQFCKYFFDCILQYRKPRVRKLACWKSGN